MTCMFMENPSCGNWGVPSCNPSHRVMTLQFTITSVPPGIVGVHTVLVVRVSRSTSKLSKKALHREMNVE